MKLVVPEPETELLRSALEEHDEWVSAIITVTEVMRATRRWIALSGLRSRAAASRVQRAEDLLASVALIDFDARLARQAGTLPPAGLRSLDAIHLATAVALAPDLVGMATFDARLAAAATAAGLVVIAASP